MDFRQFALLPAELTSLVWQFFVDAATANPRILDFSIRVDRTDHHRRWKAVPGPFLYDRVRPVIAALTVCRESRFLALKVLPDTLAVERGRRRGVVRFDKDRDVVAVSVLGVLEHINQLRFDNLVKPFHESFTHCIIPGFSDNVRNLAFQGMIVDDYMGLVPQVERYPIMIILWHLLAMFRNVRAVFELVSCDEYPPYLNAWCGAFEGVLVEEVAVHPYPRSKELEPLTTIWPDVTTYRAAGEARNVYLQPKQLGLMATNYAELIPIANRDFLVWFAEVEAWPMIQFYGSRGRRALTELRTTPVEQLPRGDGCDVSDADSCEAEADEDGSIRRGYQEEIDLGPTDSGSVCSDDLPVDMEPSVGKRRRWLYIDCGIEESEMECDTPMDLDHVCEWLNGVFLGQEDSGGPGW
ncbi:uncharacterized protein PpBr36_06608 [Pyricularia pennisetigena]|uniref:uncharacterized protein n=1 Tax=Pyricularia pennisetigena TaxID=1578925 RepID=UPI001152EB24|nr:uncharacterized protein PpBr36_06608 [Pyricularia pennisetigena]TLS23692.1 hypothetical protein PpBr36_06608 [Pyricularia pennisetigena]